MCNHCRHGHNARLGSLGLEDETEDEGGATAIATAASLGGRGIRGIRGINAMGRHAMETSGWKKASDGKAMRAVSALLESKADRGLETRPPLTD